MRKYGRLKKKDNEEGEETPTSKNGDSNKRRNQKEEISTEKIENLNDRNIISKDIDEAENYDADTVLTPDLWQVYANVKAENADFKSDIFNKNIDHLLENIGNFDSEKIKHNFNMDGFPPLMKNILTPSELLDKYTKKASQI
jgi:hypothetical protein